MAGRTGGKYAKYILEFDPSMEDKVRQLKATKELGIEVPFKTITCIDNSDVKGSNFYWVFWITPEKPIPMNIGHPPHIHGEPELLFHIGSDPENPQDLGAECELYLGEEMERYIIDKSCVVYIPPGLVHCPWKPLVTRKPWIFIEVNQAPMHTEKGVHHLLPQELKEKYPDEVKMWSTMFPDH